jgi:hypothetical protein
MQRCAAAALWRAGDSVTRGEGAEAALVGLKGWRDGCWV